LLKGNGKSEFMVTIARKWFVTSVVLVGAALLAAGGFLSFRRDDEARFIRAVQDGDVKTVIAMLSKNNGLVEVRQRQKAGSEPVLCIALRRGRNEIVRLLLSHGASPKSCPRVLWHATDAGIAELLIEYGADVNWQDENNSVPTALHFFAAVDNTELVELLIKHGADVNVIDKAGETPLHEAAREGRLNAAKLLLSKGAELNARSKKNKTPFDCAVFPVWEEDAYRLEQTRIRRCKEVASYLLECGSSYTIFDIAWLGDLERLAKTIKSDSSLVNGRANGEPLLFAAVRGGNAKVVEYLVAHGASLKVTGRFQQSPLQLAAYMGYTDIARVLLNNKADVDERGPWGETALHWAAVRGNIDVAALLLERGADATSRTFRHTVDLNVGTRIDADPVERELRWFQTQEKQRANPLLQVMVPPRLAFTKGDTALHAAAYWNHADVVRLLIGSGADINNTNCWGATPLHYAVVCCYHDIAKLLLDNGADPKTQTYELTPIEIALKVKDKKLVKLLTDRNEP
jgi:ankyrin repeat protein